MVARVIDHMSQCGAEGTLIVPEWPAEPWWPRLFPHPPARSPVTAMWRLPHDAVVPAHAGTIMSSARSPFGLLALRVDFR